MADVFQVKAIKPKKLKIPAVRQELEAALDGEGRASARELEKTTMGWRGRKPRFDYIYEVSGNDASLLVGPTGDQHAVNKWRWLDEGTRPHIIRARRAPFLRYRLGYIAGSRPGTLRTKRGYHTGGPGLWRMSRAVRHPGTEARGWSALVQRRRKPKFIKAMNDALRRGMRKAAR